MAWIFTAVVWAVSLYAVYSRIPKPQSAPPVKFSEYQTPTASEGREIGVLFGERDIEGYNCVWSGDFKSVAITKSAGKK